MPVSPRPLWTADHLRSSIARHFGDESIVVLANRQPFSHEHAPGGGIALRRSAGGLVTALEPLIQACSGVWVAHGGGSADRVVVDHNDGLNVPPGNPTYRLRRVWLDEAEQRGYYRGFANEGLWPLCHRTHVAPVFRASDFRTYEAVNARFAKAVAEEADSDSPLVLVQDYHFALAPQIIHQHLPLSTIVTFWHIPWPEPREFQACPSGHQLLKGLLGSSILGFQTPGDCQNFLETVERSLRADVDRRQNVVIYNNHRTTVRAYPISIEWPSRWVAAAPDIDSCRDAVRSRLGLNPDALLGVGVDRLDYTKGIVEKFLAVERLLEREPELVGRFTFVQIAEPSREELPAYRDLRAKVVEAHDRINSRFGTGSYRPLIVREAHHDPAEVFQFLRAADFCYVNSLHDGMNLVAKEFVCARDDERGVLVLSRFTGAAQQLAGAVSVNPYAIGRSADALARALRMPQDEQATRMRAMRTTVAESNTYWWAGQMLEDAARLRRMPAMVSRSALDQRIA